MPALQMHLGFDQDKSDPHRVHSAAGAEVLPEPSELSVKRRRNRLDASCVRQRRGRRQSDFGAPVAQLNRSPFPFSSGPSKADDQPLQHF